MTLRNKLESAELGRGRITQLQLKRSLLITINPNPPLLIIRLQFRLLQVKIHFANLRTCLIAQKTLPPGSAVASFPSVVTNSSVHASIAVEFTIRSKISWYTFYKIRKINERLLHFSTINSTNNMLIL